MTTYINVFLHDFGGIKGNEIVTQNPDGGYTVLINANLCRSKQIAAYRHAMKHIHNNDFEKADVQAIEKEAHERR